MNTNKEWINTKINDGDITCFEYDKLSNLKEICKGVLYRADLDSKGIQIALKTTSYRNATIDKYDFADLVKEINLLRIFHYHPNINHFIGMAVDDDGIYKMLLEYANMGNLRDYLGNKRKFSSLQWKDKIKMALDITSGLLCLHSENIIHRDLHSKNILVHNNRLMIADFRSSKKIIEVSTSSKVEGLPAYIDPQCFMQENYIINKKSDIFSLGILLWEITSGRPPFLNIDNRYTLIYQLITSQIREEPVESTPLKYQQLYQKCWNENPALRPESNEVNESLNQLLKSRFINEFKTALIIEDINKMIKVGEISQFDYSEFSNFEEIGNGRFGIVNRADFVSRGIQIALKSLLNRNTRINKDVIADLVKELNIHIHPNIFQFIGITVDNDGDYKLVLEYANGGNLRNYLGNKIIFNSLKWKDKIQMALDITCGLSYLHKNEIIHGNLKINEVATSSRFKGLPEYIDPQCYIQENYESNYKSDIYSLGVLLWEITSGRPPFSNIDDRYTLINQLINSQIREEPVELTPLKYQRLYQKCWSENPNKRPNIEEAYEGLMRLTQIIEIESMIEDEVITYFEYSDLHNIVKIGSGGFGVVSKADFASRGIKVALKSFLAVEKNNDDFTREVKLLRKFHYHPNINRFLGITKDSDGYYIMVLEYANEGNLRDYLGNENIFKMLQWKDKVRMSLDIASGLMCLHKEEIIHRDLHSMNILVNNGKLLLADFGLSKHVAETTSNSKTAGFGMIEYIDPQCYKHQEFKRGKKSDIFSLGVILWEITSGHPPFSDTPRHLVNFTIFSKKRETPVENTPLEYKQLYQECWDEDPNKRPNIEEVYRGLKQLEFIFYTNEIHLMQSAENSAITAYDNSVEIINFLGNKSQLEDFHSGNILQGNNNSYISDFGLTGPADKQKSDDRIYGVLPYIAPEVLNGEPYTFASDIYSFGVIMAEYSSGNPPFYDREHDYKLSLDICNGLRPEFGKGTPEFYKILAYRCMNANPNQRLTSDELYDILDFCYSSTNYYENEIVREIIRMINKDYVPKNKNKIIIYNHEMLRGLTLREYHHETSSRNVTRMKPYN
ncbi:16411_t:CDS:10 [Funneliformis geosporum]|nr:16411_t:CDS:10 [Funneliformis geosporum]